MMIPRTDAGRRLTFYAVLVLGSWLVVFALGWALVTGARRISTTLYERGTADRLVIETNDAVAAIERIGRQARR